MVGRSLLGRGVSRGQNSPWLALPPQHVLHAGLITCTHACRHHWRLPGYSVQVDDEGHGDYRPACPRPTPAYQQGHSQHALTCCCYCRGGAHLGTNVPHPSQQRSVLQPHDYGRERGGPGPHPGGGP